MKKDAAMVRDGDGNEMYFGETGGKCQRWCKEHGVTGENGEYIAFGKFDEDTRYFDIEDYTEIDRNYTFDDKVEQTTEEQAAEVQTTACMIKEERTMTINGRRRFNFEGKRYHVSDLCSQTRKESGKKYMLEEIDNEGRYLILCNICGWDIPKFDTIKEAQRYVRDWSFMLAPM